MAEEINWRNFEISVKAEARPFCQTAASRLTSIFDGIDELKTRDGRPLMVDAGPGSGLHTVYRARIFQSDDQLEIALGRPEIHLGSPPASLAVAGRMNARGTSVFYGANSRTTAIAEVRPPVGAHVAVAQFEIIRKLRLLDLTALGDVRATESLFDIGLAGRRETAVFLRLLSRQISRPIMREDEPFEYLATQATVNFLATEATMPIDGILFPSLQAVGSTFNVVLFHNSARVQAMDIPEGAEISASTGRWTEEGWVDDYEVIEKVPPLPNEVGRSERDKKRSNVTAMARGRPIGSRDADLRDPSLRVVSESMEVHRVKGVEFVTEEFPVRRHRREK
jgi:hypothetical protein